MIDASTGAPVPGATVNWNKGGPSTPASITQTDSEGRFTFTRLDAGEYVIRSQFAGYEDGYFGNAYAREGFTAQLPLKPGEQLDIVIKMWRAGVVTGTVLEQDGQPAVGLEVHALRRQGTRWTLATLLGKSNDRGQYRTVLPPGEYLIVIPANGRANSALLHTTYAPAESTSATAIPVRVDSGIETTGVDLRVNVAQASGTGRRVAGWVTGPDGTVASIEVRLTPNPAGAMAMYDQRTTTTDARGRFEFRGVTEGSYTLQAVRFPSWSETEAGARLVGNAGFGGGITFTRDPSSPPMNLANFSAASTPKGTTMSAAVDLTVDRDREDVEAQLLPAARIRGRAVFDGADAPTGADMLSLAAMVTAADERHLPNVPQGHLETNGTFASVGLPPGHYSVSLFTVPFLGLPPGWTVASVKQNGKDITGRAIELGTADAEIVLTYTRKTTGLSGTVRDPQGRPAPSGRVYVFPQQAVLRDAIAPRLVQQTQTSPTGGFEVKRMIPGSYFVAYTTDPAEDWSVPGFLESLERTAVTVDIRLGETKALDLRTSPPR